MAEITVQLPEPIIIRLREQALKSQVSLPELVSQRLMEDFDIAVCTEVQARRRALKLLREHAGYMLRTGTPIFDANTFTWSVPVLPNIKDGKPEPIGEVCLKADTGEILTDSFAILEMSNKAGTLLGVERFDEGFQKRLEELFNKNNSGELSQAERCVLEEMVQKIQAKDLENIQRLIEQLRLPKTNRKKAFAALKRASVALENPTHDETKETRISK
ncbi:TPA: hypothetical protein EYP66_00880 [Candidatus Poribacteria bacterium]|nr:hypothetical protein [Candidatus Poribacteria bacterium]